MKQEPSTAKTEAALTETNLTRSGPDAATIDQSLIISGFRPTNASHRTHPQLKDKGPEQQAAATLAPADVKGDMKTARRAWGMAFAAMVALLLAAPAGRFGSAPWGARSELRRRRQVLFSQHRLALHAFHLDGRPERSFGHHGVYEGAPV